MKQKHENRKQRHEKDTNIVYYLQTMTVIN